MNRNSSQAGTVIIYILLVISMAALCALSGTIIYLYVKNNNREKLNLIYTIEYYFQSESDPTEFILDNSFSEEKKGYIDEIVKIDTTKTIKEGFIFDESNAKNNTLGKISNNLIVHLKAYYKRV